ncbi:hypothetical protein BDZ45DRAFT_592796, partial [Acephala macrosclerotiorum]
IEIKPMKNSTSKKIAKFIYNNIICRHDVFDYIKLNEGLEFKGTVIKELNRFEIKRITISVYNSKTNEIIEREY